MQSIFSLEKVLYILTVFYKWRTLSITELYAHYTLVLAVLQTMLIG